MAQAGESIVVIAAWVSLALALFGGAWWLSKLLARGHR
jgi:hypothetical protein